MISVGSMSQTTAMKRNVKHVITKHGSKFGRSVSKSSRRTSLSLKSICFESQFGDPPSKQTSVYCEGYVNQRLHLTQVSSFRGRNLKQNLRPILGGIKISDAVCTSFTYAFHITLHISQNCRTFSAQVLMCLLFP